MKIVQINAIYGQLSTGRTMQEMHEWLLENGVDSFVVSPKISGNITNSIIMGTSFGQKVHAIGSRITGLQSYFSRCSTKKLLKALDKINPDILILRNLHSNYIDFPVIMEYIAKNRIPVIFVLHDCWFFTGKCVYFHEDNCDRWKASCGNCPALNKGNKSLFFDQSSKMLRDKRNLYQKLNVYAVIGVSDWVTGFIPESILGKASIIKRIYNWIDLSVFKPHNADYIREKYNLPNKKILLGVAAFWDNLKGYAIFDQLAEMIDDQKYIIVLLGNNANVESNPKIIFPGQITSKNELSDFYCVSEVLINPSIQETFGKTTAEALSCGTPVIGFYSTATPELIGEHGECGGLVSENTPQKYLEALSVIENNGGKKRYESKCREKACLSFDKEKNLKEYLDLFEIINEKRKV